MSACLINLQANIPCQPNTTVKKNQRPNCVNSGLLIDIYQSRNYLNCVKRFLIHHSISPTINHFKGRINIYLDI